jgi:hypothetical protein
MNYDYWTEHASQKKLRRLGLNAALENCSCQFVMCMKHHLILTQSSPR